MISSLSNELYQGKCDKRGDECILIVPPPEPLRQEATGQAPIATVCLNISPRGARIAPTFISIPVFLRTFPNVRRTIVNAIIYRIGSVCRKRPKARTNTMAQTNMGERKRFIVHLQTNMNRLVNYCKRSGVCHLVKVGFCKLPVPYL